MRAETYGADYTPQGGKTEIDATPAYAKAATREAQVGTAAQRIASELGTAHIFRIFCIQFSNGCTINNKYNNIWR